MVQAPCRAQVSKTSHIRQFGNNPWDSLEKREGGDQKPLDKKIKTYFTPRSLSPQQPTHLTVATGTMSALLPPASLAKLKTIEDRIAYKYSQDRIDQGLDQDGNDIDSYRNNNHGDDNDDQALMNWLFKTLVKLEETAPPEEEEHEGGTVITEETQEEKEYRQEHEQLTDRVSACVAHFCGRAASGAMTRTWTFRSTPSQSLQIHDPSFTGGDVGFKTFGSAYLLSK